MSADPTPILSEARRSGAAFFCPKSDVTPSHAPSPTETLDQQGALRLAFGVHREPKDAPTKLVRLVDSPAQALAVSIKSAKLKQGTVAHLINRSRTYVSLMCTGKRPIPDKLVKPLCAATGSNLLAQVIALHAALEDACPVERLAKLLREES